MTLGQGIELGPLHFPFLRMLLAVGFVRVILRGERMGRMNSLDRLMVVWAVWTLLSSVFHNKPADALVYRLGFVYNACGIYFLLRIFCRSLEDVMTLCRITAVLLIPLSLLVIPERVTGHNLFAALGGVPAISELREGRFRAQGPFAHSILAGTVGAVCLPLMIALWQKQRKTAVAGIVACCSLVFASASSGPIMSVLAAVGALLMWHWRQKMRLIRWSAVLGYIGLDLVMKAPAYYVLSHIDLTGSSTSWHRARLIESAIEFLPEWWLSGTDYTRHWMPTGVPWSSDHTDITNHYLRMGVLGGLPLMFLFIAVLAKGFSYVGQSIQKMSQYPPESRFTVWILGAMLFAHAVTFISVSYYDQSLVFIYLTLAAIGSIWSEVVGGESRLPVLPARHVTTGRLTGRLR